MAPSGRAENKDLGFLHPPGSCSSGAIPAAAAAGGGTAAEEKALLFLRSRRYRAGHGGKGERDGWAKTRAVGQRR